MKATFSMGQLVMTRGIADQVEESKEFAEFVRKSLHRYIFGDWGDLCEDDKRQNDDAAANGDDRILAAYIPPQHPELKIWIITEWDRSATTVLFPSEY